MDLAVIDGLINGFLSPDHSTRTEAEKRFNDMLAASPDATLVSLAQAIVQGQNTSIKSTAAVVFRRYAGKQPPNTDTGVRLVDIIPAAARQQIREALWRSLMSESDVGVLHKISDAIALVAKGSSGLSPSESWPNFLTHLIEITKSPSPALREAPFRMISTMPNTFSPRMLDLLLPAFDSAFADPNDSVRLAAVSAFTNVFTKVPESYWKQLKKLFPSLLNVLPPFYEKRDSESLGSAFSNLVDLAIIAPKLFRDVFPTILEFSISVMESPDFDDKTRSAAVELLVCFAEESPKMVKSDPTYINKLVPACLRLLTLIGEDDDDAADWLDEDPKEELESEALAATAGDALDRLALSLNGGVVLPPFFQYLPEMISSNDWHAKHAALIAISSVAEGCAVAMIGELNQILNAIIPLSKDPHPRVRWACCNAIGQMCTDFCPKLQTKFGSVVVPAILATLHASESRVACHGAAAIVNFCDGATDEVLEPYLDNMLEGLLTLLQSSKQYAQEQALTTIAVVAESAESKFVKYYDTLMPLLINVLKADLPKDHRSMKAKSIECCALIANAVGKDKFMPQAQEVIQLFGSIQQGITDADDPCASYLLEGWERICATIGEEFVPFLPSIIDPLIEVAKSTASLALIEDEEDIARYDSEQWEILAHNGRHIGINTSGLEDKCLAIEIIGRYAENLGSLFAPYIERVMQDVIIPSLTFLYSDDARVAAAQSGVALILAAKDASGDNINNITPLWTLLFQNLLSALIKEPVEDVAGVFYVSISSICKINKGSSVTSQELKSLSDAMESSLSEYITTVNIGGGLDDEDDEFIEEGEEMDDKITFVDLMNSLVSCFDDMLSIKGELFLREMEPHLDSVFELLSLTDVDSVCWGLDLVNSLIKNIGEPTWAYKDRFLPVVAQGLESPHTRVRQGAATVVGTAALHGGNSYKTTVLQTIPYLDKIVNKEDSRETENIDATEAAITTVAKIIRTYGSDLPDVNTAIQTWIRMLPVLHNEEEAAFTYMFLAELMTAHHFAVSNNFPAVFNAVLTAIEMDSIQGKVLKHVVEATKEQLSHLPPGEADKLLQSLSPELQGIVRATFG
ncbi:hypothetical protein CANCADRAFT_99901 [Tortispora caseinolytica NRRL Y-17796]|uniref:Importin N-terminal domain-containing protein n=1 Tax=Tortispora caseinolytica NRRL Y-17796 TaxID=767744 RepID=A0A1E4TEF0_9ASCO|nr:hypothetical protein CANCADRAFT_99901 [Tortispora caseinolytica NRRL Y-17796]